MSCCRAEFEELLDLYAIGALDGPEREAFERHLLAGCDACRAATAESERALALLALAAPAAEPSPAVRARILESLPRSSRPRRLGAKWLAAAAAALLVAAAVGWGLWWKRGAESDAVSRVLAVAQADLAFLSDPATRRVEMTSEPGKGSAIATAFVNPATGRTVVRGVRMPELPAGRVYQLWYVNQVEKPLSGGTFTRAESERGYAHQGPRALKDEAVLALTLEPEGGSLGPTTSPFAFGLLARN